MWYVWNKMTYDIWLRYDCDKICVTSFDWFEMICENMTGYMETMPSWSNENETITIEQCKRNIINKIL